MFDSIARLNLIGWNINAALREPILRHPMRFFGIYLVNVLVFTTIITYAMKNYKDVDQFAEALTGLMLYMLTSTKLFSFLPRANEEESLKWYAANQKQQRLNMVYSVFCTSTVIFAIVAPFIYSFQGYQDNGEFVFLLPLPAIFPYEFQSLLYYIPTLMTECVFLVFALIVLLSIDGQFCTFVYQISAHFEILCIKIEKLASDFVNIYAREAEFQQQFAAIVDYHVACIQLANELQSIYRFVLLGEVTFSILHLCSGIFRLMGNFNPSNVLLMALLIVSIATHLFIYCFGGAMLRNQSEMVAHVIQISLPWHEMDGRACRLFLLPMKQRPIDLSGVFFVSNRKLLVWIFQTAGSFNALLLALKDK